MITTGILKGQVWISLMLTQKMLIDTRLRINMTSPEPEIIIKMSFLLNVSNDAGSKPEEFSLDDTEVLVDQKEQNCFKRPQVGKFLGLVHFHRSTAKLAVKDQKTRTFLKAERGCHNVTSREEAEDHDIFHVTGQPSLCRCKL